MSRPSRPLAAISLAALVRPAAPRSCSATNAPAPASSRQQSMSLRSVKGSLTCTDGRLSSSSSSSAEASTLAPPMPSRPVRLPISTSGVARARGRGPQHPVRVDDAHAHGVDQARLLVAVVERHLAADGRHPDAVPVVADAGHRAREQVAAARARQLAEAQGVEQRDRPRAHREDVAHDAADAGGRALEGLHGRRVVVALDLQRHGQPVAHVHHAGVLARALQHAIARSWGRPPAAACCACRSSARST